MALISEFEGIDCRERSVKSGETLRPFIEDPSNVQLEGISKHSQCNGSGSREKSLRASKLGKVRRTVSKDEKNCARYSDLFMQSLIQSQKGEDHLQSIHRIGRTKDRCEGGSG